MPELSLWDRTYFDLRFGAWVCFFFPFLLINWLVIYCLSWSTSCFLNLLAITTMNISFAPGGMSNVSTQYFISHSKCTLSLLPLLCSHTEFFSASYHNIAFSWKIRRLHTCFPLGLRKRTLSVEKVSLWFQVECNTVCQVTLELDISLFSVPTYFIHLTMLLFWKLDGSLWKEIAIPFWTTVAT